MKTIATILRDHARETDFVARYGGEEFTVLMPQTDVATAYQVAERLRAAVESHPWTERAVTVSVGLASSFHGVPDERELVGLADEGLYLSKQHGRNTVTVARRSVSLGSQVAKHVDSIG